ncbi:hypothetical protein TVAG_190840 [Trichomonas vaginalis G3]|uniref:Wntless-like transmembrane domain-containing protein n=1 Tax=Trichomonas vaginalis (strain ATCC PRA-98 / G3) TaxID=412133 RepID=A2EFG7_TRIV3|nr:transmembrane protein 181 family [Trichomonas vaginalis G3]EAY08561.1 hypothetical protein TVAG_190840 [Trichomonas vaginalis G3]KAI5497846.1 transmembrane protein 181 family [Trichomonas vaginalis G3]|eukprot:XP_001320784.1 hypothetical protein [Trichomonas vaginalis G3]
MISQNADSSSGNMIDIQIEESLGRETLMTIDSSNFKEDLFSILGFIIILVITTITGIIGPKSYDCHAQKLLIDQNKLEMQLSHNHISVYNRYTKIFIEFEKDSSNEIPKSVGLIDYSIALTNKKVIVNNYYGKISNQTLNFQTGSSTSDQILLYSSPLIEYDAIRIDIVVTDAEHLRAAQVSHYLATIQHSYYEIYFRTAFAIIEFMLLILFVFSLRKVSYSFWHLEQKLTLHLQFLSMLFNNPLIYLTITYPSKTGLILDILIKSIFTTYFRYFVLVLFDSLRYKNRKTDPCFFVPKILFSFAMFATIYLNTMITELPSYLPFELSDEVKKYIDTADTALFGVYLVWAAITTLFAGCQVDITERYKYVIYIISGIAALALLATSELLFKFFKFFQDSSLQFVEQFSIYNVFSMLMVYFHWPFEIFRDQDYLDGDLQADLPGQFFVNEDEE